jgi:MFS transporter, NNP family, nitrate/nitrite transporter
MHEALPIKNKATKIDLFNFSTPQMRAFHATWFAFFLCFFAWFGIAPLMAIVRDELSLTKAQIGNTIIASVSVTVFARLFIGWACDRVGPRLTYTWLLMIGSLPVMGIGFADDYSSFLLFRLGIGVIGAAFVITQYHTSVMFAPNVVGTANATSAGWGNLGGGVTQMVMPLVFAGFVGLGYSQAWSWRLSMVVAGGVCFITGIAYYFVTTDLPDGNFKELREKGEYRPAKKVKGTFAEAAKDKRVWALFMVYGACFGVELTINNIAAMYYIDNFGLELKTAGLVAGLFGLMNIFARTTGGVIGDKFGAVWGLRGRVRWLFVGLIFEACSLILFSRMTVLPIAIGSMVIFGLFVHMSEGATYSVVPFINKRALGSVAGIVGAGGNAGAVAAGFLFRSDILWEDCLLILGFVVFIVAFVTYLVTFSPEEEAQAAEAYVKALEERRALQGESESKRPPTSVVLAWVQPMAVLRIFLGFALIVKGIYFILNMAEIEALTQNLGLFDTTIAWYVVLAHIAGGMGLVVGMFTRGAAAANVLVLIGAIVFVHGSESMFGEDSGLQFSILVLVCLSLFVWKGAGRLSMDYLRQWSNQDNQATANAEPLG